MATLNHGEKKKLEEFLGMGSGYVLNLSDRTFREFVDDSVGMDIDDPNVGGVGSKARRLRHFWTCQPDYIVGKLLRDLIESVETDDGDSNSFGTVRYGIQRTSAQKAECLKIADRLLQAAPVSDTTVITVLSKREEFDRLAKGVLDSINKNDPESGLDRLHTFTITFMRSLCEKNGVTIDRDEPLHSLSGKYVKKLKELGLIESQMTERILKSSISVLEYFNDVRNNKSLAHANAVLNRSESLLIFQHVTSLITFVWTIEQGSLL
jgi:abortive infection Abi-like protein